MIINIKNKKMILLIAGSAALLITAGIVYLLIIAFTPDGSDSNSYTDPGSGETIYDSNLTESVNDTVTDDGISFLGFSKLLDSGVEPEQIDTIKKQFGVFSMEQGVEVTEVSITTQSINQESDPDNSQEIISFEATINRQTKLQAKATYNIYDASSNIYFELYNPADGSKVYTSQ